MKKIQSLFFILFSLSLFIACSIVPDYQDESNRPYIEKYEPAAGKNDKNVDKEKKQNDDKNESIEEKKRNDDSCTSNTYVKFENQSRYSVTVYLDNPKYTENATALVKVGAYSSTAKKCNKSVKDAVTFFFVYDLNNFGKTIYPYIPQDTSYDHKTQRLAENATTNVIIDEIGNLKTDSAFLLLRNETTASIYLQIKNTPRIPYGAEYKEINARENALYEIDGRTFPFDSAEKTKVVINSSYSLALPTITYEAGKVYTVVVKKDSVSLEKKNYFPTSGNLYQVNFENENQREGTKSVKSIEIEAGKWLEYENLPVPEAQQGYDFAGWYSGNKKIEAGFKVTNNLTLTARWIKRGWTSETIDNLDLSLHGEKYTIRLTGEITDTTLNTIINKIYEAKNYIVLDLSDTTGISEIKKGWDGYSIFKDCTFLKEIKLPKTLTTIGDYAFWGCESIESIIIPDSVTNIGEMALGATNIKAIVLPANIKILSNNLFSNCHNLSSITIPTKVSKIGKEVFYNCNNLTSVIFEDTSTWYTSIFSSNTGYYREYMKEVSVKVPKSNATYLTSTYLESYWYKE